MLKYQAFLEAFILSFIIGLFLTPAMARLSVKLGILDKPEDRKVHKRPIPLLGGLAIFFGFFIALLITLLTIYIIGSKHMKLGFMGERQIRLITGFFIGGTLLVIMGIFDDWKGLPAKFKFAVQILIALLLYYFGFRIEFITIPFYKGIDFPAWLSIIVTVFWIVGITNAVNLLDGLDGLLAGVSGISSIILLVVSMHKGHILVALLFACVAGATLGFLRYNFHPAKVFMGDTGSLFLGMTFASLTAMGTLKSTATWALFVPVLIMGLPILDTTFAIIRRLISKKPIFQPDKGHLHHRLLDSGLGQRKVVLLIYLINVILGTAGLIIAFVVK